MTRASKTGIAWTGALAAVLVAVACGKTSEEPGGESHFICRDDEDCHGGAVCVRENPSDEEGECRAPSNGSGGAGSADSGPSESGGAGGAPSNGGAGGAPSNGGAAGQPVGSGGTPGAGGQGSGGGGSGSGVGGPFPIGTCNSACCPEDASCYGTPSGESGRECLALRDNTGQARIRLRQTSVDTLSPPGYAIGIIRTTRDNYSHLPLESCLGGTALQGGRLIELLDLNLGNDTDATSGYSDFISPEGVTARLSNGLCMARGEYAGDAAYRLGQADMSDSSSYPAGLPPPRGLSDGTWPVGSIRYKRLETDFHLVVDRTAILASLAPSGALGSAGYEGVFFYDESGGRYHSYAPVTYVVHYNAGIGTVSSVVTPVRELETRFTFNDPAHPNCVGAFHAKTPELGCGNGPPAGWGGVACEDGTCTPTVEPSAEQAGYMLLTELDQVYEPVLRQTLCVVAQGTETAYASGFLSESDGSCRSDRWNPSAPNGEGLPFGDWCAATNAPATATCHDAMRLREWRTYAATELATENATELSLCTLR